MRRVQLAVVLAALTSGLFVAAGAAEAQVADWPTERPPRPLPARAVKFPPYQFRTLSNGLQVIAVSHHEQPAVSLRLIIRAGGAQDPTAKAGLAGLAAALLDQGTTAKSAEQIAGTIESIGGLVGAGAGSDLTFVNAVVMKDSLDVALDLVSEIARSPQFAQEEIDRQKQQILSSLRVSYEDPDYIAGVVFDRLVYGFHPYGRPDSGTPQTISSITRDDLLAYHKGWFGANNAILAIVGDVSPDVAFAGAERAFGKWGKAENTAPKATDPPPPTRRLLVIDRPGSVQTEIRVGNVGLPRKHPDYLALDLAIKILGGEGGNRLHRVLRSERGLTYGASADTNALKDTGDIVADTDTRSDSTAEALRLMVDEMWRLQRQRVSERELSDAQAYLTGSFPLTIETPSAIALQVLNAVFYGLDLEELQTYRERVNAVTPDDIQRVARAYLHPDRLSMVLVGDASTFAKQLAGAGFDQFERISLGDLDLGATDLRRPGVPTARPPAREPVAYRQGPAAQVPVEDSARALIDRAVRAKGGLARLQAIRTVHAEATTIVDLDGKRIEVPTTTWIRYPDAYRVDARTPAGTVTQVFVAGDFFVNDGAGVKNAPAEAAAEMRGHIRRDSIPLLIALAEGRITATRLTIDHQGRPFPALRIESAEMGPLMLVFDPESALVARQVYAVASSASDVAEETFSDYRLVNGIRVAFRAALRRPGAPSIERVVQRVEYDVPLDPSLFSRQS